MRHVLLLLLVATPALAAPTFHPKNAQSVRVMLGDKRENGFGLRQARGEWKLELGRTEAEAADVVDVTSGTPGMKWQVNVDGGALRFEGDRFRADHAYRVELRRGQKTVGSALVYLYPPKVAARVEVQFEDGDTSADGEMATLPKPTL